MKPKKNIKVKFAFSLVEMLMALLVASLLMTALAPVITRHTKADEVSVYSGNPLAERKVCGYVNDTYEDIKADDCIVPDDAYYGSAIIVSGGGGGSGAKDAVISGEKSLTYNGPSTASSTNTWAQSEFVFDKNINTIFIKMVAGGGGGGGGNYNANFAGSSSGCEKITGTDTTGQSGYAAYDSANKLCVTKYNQVSNPSDYTTYKLTDWNDTKCTSDYIHTGRCNANKNTMAYVYSGCNRPVCTHSGAEAACSKLASDTKLGWRLPSKAELEKWSSSHVAKFALCTNAESGTAFNLTSYCNHSSNYIYNSVGANGLTKLLYFHSHPYEIWTKDVYDASSYWAATFQTYWSLAYMVSGWPLSVRCVANSQYNLFTGGGGGGSSYMSMHIPKKVINYVTNNGNTGVLKAYAGAGGKGGVKLGGQKASNGSPSRVEVYAKTPNGSLTLIWAIQIEGAYSGGNSSTTAAGSGGYTRGYGYCSYLYKSVAGGSYDNEVKGECAKLSLPDYGPSWSTPGKGGNDATNPGVGGNIYWQGTTGAPTSVNTVGAIGSGGGGGTCDINDNGAVICNNGGDGGPGKVEIVYTTKAPGIGGSGGGAGGLLHIVNFKANPKSKIEIQAGKRGKGGGAGADGADGGESYIKIGSKTYSVSGGKGAKAGVQGTPPNDNISNATMPKAGKAGEGSKIASTEGIKYNGENGKEGTPPDALNLSQSKGGNGGVNPKIALFSDIPCGGLSTTSIQGIACNRTSYMPASLTRILTKDDFNSAFKSTYGAGASGGGGGAWNDNLNEAVSAASGADGLGGYVFVYFGPW